MIARVRMSEPTSFFLDVLRLGAALTVFAGHAAYLFYQPAPGTLWMELPHRAVIVFFVLSGYVIAYSTFQRALDPRSYVVARLSRLYSVLLPALLLTLFLQIIGTLINPHFYQQFERGHDAVRYVLTAFFLQSVWMTNTAPSTNGPCWSLGYEFWYYALFGAAVLIRSRRVKIAVMLILAGLAGLNILLLLPHWLMGVFLCLYGHRIIISRAWAFLGLAVVFLALVLTVAYVPDYPMYHARQPLYNSSPFVSDALIGLLVTGLIYFFDCVFQTPWGTEWLDAKMRWMADHTFSLYLYHFPLLVFASGVIPFDRGDVLQTGFVLTGILGVIVVLGVFTEAKRPLWRKFFGWCWDLFFKHVPAGR